VSGLQHQRLAELARELRLSAIPDLYSAIAQSAAAKAASYADFLEEILRIDDIGYLPLAHEQANLFFQVVFG